MREATFSTSLLVLKEGSDDDDEHLFSAAAVVNGVVGCGNFNGTWNGVTSEGDDFAAVKLNSGGTVAWRFQVRSNTFFVSASEGTRREVG